MSDNVYLQFASNLRSLREKKGITRWKLSKMVGVAYYTYRHWECGTRLPGFVYGCKLARALGVEVGSLLWGIDLDAWSSGSKGTPVSQDERLLPRLVSGPYEKTEGNGSKKADETL